MHKLPRRESNQSKIFNKIDWLVFESQLNHLTLSSMVGHILSHVSGTLRYIFANFPTLKICYSLELQNFILPQSTSSSRYEGNKYYGLYWNPQNHFLWSITFMNVSLFMKSSEENKFSRKFSSQLSLFPNTIYRNMNHWS